MVMHVKAPMEFGPHEGAGLNEIHPVMINTDPCPGHPNRLHTIALPPRAGVQPCLMCGRFLFITAPETN